MNILDKLSGARIFHELCKMLEDEKPVECLRRCQTPFKILTAINSNFEKVNFASLEKAVDVIRLFDLLKIKDANPSIWKFYFLVLIKNMGYVVLKHILSDVLTRFVSRWSEMLEVMHRLLIQDGVQVELKDMHNNSLAAMTQLKGIMGRQTYKNSEIYFVLKVRACHGFTLACRLVFILLNGRTSQSRVSYMLWSTWTLLKLARRSSLT